MPFFKLLRLNLLLVWGSTASAYRAPFRQKSDFILASRSLWLRCRATRTSRTVPFRATIRLCSYDVCRNQVLKPDSHVLPVDLTKLIFHGFIIKRKFVRNSSLWFRSRSARVTAGTVDFVKHFWSLLSSDVRKATLRFRVLICSPTDEDVILSSLQVWMPQNGIIRANAVLIELPMTTHAPRSNRIPIPPTSLCV